MISDSPESSYKSLSESASNEISDSEIQQDDANLWSENSDSNSSLRAIDESNEAERQEEAQAKSEETIKSRRVTRHSFKLTDETIKTLENDNVLRRSGRKRMLVYESASRNSIEKEFANQDEVSSDEEDYEEAYTQSVKRRKRIRVNSDSTISDDDNRPTRSTAKNNKRKQINYKDLSSDDEINSDDVLEWEEETGAGNGAENADGSSSAEFIEKVMRHRAGYPGATGPATICYNVEEKGDPNEILKDPKVPLEKQFLIKWQGWSHIHNTWESEESLKQMNAKGVKKVDNYLKRLREYDEWKSTADKESIEFFECEREMHDELFEQYKHVERIVAHQVSREGKDDNGGIEYFVKWLGLPYSECTWENESIIGSRARSQIDAYLVKKDNDKLPYSKCSAFPKRPKFVLRETLPDYLKRSGEMEQLRDYQLDGVNWLVRAWTKENSCILADEMGLGKTIQSIGFLSTLYNEYGVCGPFLVVVPLSTMTSWQREFEMWAGFFNVISYIGDANSRESIREYEMFKSKTKQLKFHVLITTYEMLSRDKAFLGSFDWSVLVVDEAHRLKNNESIMYRCLMDFSTDHRLLVTGTPLQNSLKELWALLYFIMPQKFESWEEFNEEHHENDQKAIKSLHEKLRPFLLRRVKKDVEKSLPAKVEQILRVDLTAQQKQYYKLILTKNYKELSKGVRGSINGFINIIMELKKCCNHASLVRAYDYYEISQEARLQQLLKSSGKLILLDKLLCRLRQTGHRVLIFSQMVMMLDILQEYLTQRRFQYQRLDGSMRSDLRKAALDHFNAEGSSDFCFLLSTRAGGLGINLATADTVIIFDSDWNPQNDLQAMSRAHRIGQKKQVNIYRLVSKASVEEEIVERAKQKLVLDHLVIQLMDKSGRTIVSKNTNGSTPFEKHELAEILKFGAEELFKEKEGEEQEPDVDIDDILRVAETRECDQQDVSSELLNSFKYTDLTIDEEKDVQALTVNMKNEDMEGKEWSEIIPEDERVKYEEEERQRAERELFLPPRQRFAVPKTSTDDNDDRDFHKGNKKRKTKGISISDNDSSDDDKRRKPKKKLFNGFTDAEIRRFVKSFRKFADPLKRLEAIAEDAELEEHSKRELNELGEILLKNCMSAQNEIDKTFTSKNDRKQTEEGKKKQNRGPVFKLGSVDVYARKILKAKDDLEPLKNLSEILEDFKRNEQPKPIKDLDIPWVMEDDIMLLQGILRHGMGNWEAIKLDPEYGLADKISLKDKNSRKLQARHLQARCEYLLKLLARTEKRLDLRRKVESHPVSSKKEHGKSTIKKALHKTDMKLKMNKKVSESQNKSEQKSGEKLAKLEHLNINLKFNDVVQSGSPTFKECVDIMRPVQKHLKCFNLSSGPESAEWSKSLLKIGDYINDYLIKSAECSSEKNLERWHSLLWIFFSRFNSHQPENLLQSYRQVSKNRLNLENVERDKHRHHHHHHHHRRQAQIDYNEVQTSSKHTGDHKKVEERRFNQTIRGISEERTSTFNRQCHQHSVETASTNLVTPLSRSQYHNEHRSNLPNRDVDRWKYDDKRYDGHKQSFHHSRNDASSSHNDFDNRQRYHSVEHQKISNRDKANYGNDKRDRFNWRDKDNNNGSNWASGGFGNFSNRADRDYRTLSYRANHPSTSRFGSSNPDNMYRMTNPDRSRSPIRYRSDSSYAFAPSTRHSGTHQSTERRDNTNLSHVYMTPPPNPPNLDSYRCDSAWQK